jgi:hypothetical protein
MKAVSWMTGVLPGKGEMLFRAVSVAAVTFAPACRGRAWEDSRGKAGNALNLKPET